MFQQLIYLPRLAEEALLKLMDDVGADEVELMRKQTKYKDREHDGHLSLTLMNYELCE